MNLEVLHATLHANLEKDDRVAGQANQIFITPRLSELFKRADDESQRLNDEFIGTEHLQNNPRILGESLSSLLLSEAPYIHSYPDVPYFPHRQTGTRQAT